MIFEWDERKRLINLRKQGFDFRDCAAVFRGPILSIPDERVDYGERRLRTYGLLRGQVVVVAHTEGTDVVRIISMRKASRREQAQYFENLQD